MQQFQDFSSCVKNKKNPIQQSFSPVVGQEDDVGDSDDDIQPTPVGDEVGEQREEEDADAEEHLIEDSHGASVLHAHDLCD